MSSLSESGEIVVVDEAPVVDAVAYIGPNRPKANFFQPEWPIMRMLVVSPGARGQGVGRLLTEECLSLARCDGAMQCALHTSPVMGVALPMYLRMGFKFHASAPLIHSIECGIYLRGIDA